MKAISLANEELNKWCGTEGINYYEGDTALGFLFKYAVPKATEMFPPFGLLCSLKRMALGVGYFAYITNNLTDYLSQKRKVSIINVTTYDKDPALALFWALWKIIQGEKNG